MRMPGCHEVIVNNAHRRDFQYSFRTASSTRDVQAALNDERGLTLDSESLKHLPCYCYPLDSILAIVGRHCVFERSYTTLQNKSKHSHDDFAAIRFSQDHQRVYHLYLSSSQKYEGENFEYLNAELKHFVDVRIAVRTIKKRGEMPEVLAASLTSGGRNVSKPCSCKVSAEEGYVATFQLLSDLVRELERATALSRNEQSSLLRDTKEELLSTMGSLRKIIDYEAVRGFVNGIFSFSRSSQGIKSLEQILDELRLIKERLFDAIIVEDIIIKDILSRFVVPPQGGR